MLGARQVYSPDASLHTELRSPFPHAASGALAWWLLPDSGLPDFVMLTLAGMAVGGIVDWGIGANNANASQPFSIPAFSIPVG